MKSYGLCVTGGATTLVPATAVVTTTAAPPTTQPHQAPLAPTATPPLHHTTATNGGLGATVQVSAVVTGSTAASWKQSSYGGKAVQFTATQHNKNLHIKEVRSCFFYMFCSLIWIKGKLMYTTNYDKHK